MSRFPNTKVENRFLTADVILCCGEDKVEFEHAIRKSYGRAKLVHNYRCYTFYALRNITFIWTGIGSGCLEPLLCEILSFDKVERIILVGTAGITGRRKMPLGTACAITKATCSCAGVDPKKTWTAPNWAAIPAEIPSASILSTDYYYGFSPGKGWPYEALKSSDRKLAASVTKSLKSADLIDMETGQFYHLCSVLRPELQYLALKGAANPVTNFSEQTKHSGSVLMDSLACAKLAGVA